MDVKAGNKLQTLRKNSGYTKQQLATIIGVSENEITKWEQTASQPEADKLVALSTLFKTSLDEILTEDN